MHEAFVHEVPFAEEVTMIGSNHHHGIVKLSGLLEHLEDASHVLVKTDRGRVMHFYEAFQGSNSGGIVSNLVITIRKRAGLAGITR